MAKMDIAERPRKTRIGVGWAQRPDLRVSTMPTTFGAVVIGSSTRHPDPAGAMGFARKSSSRRLIRRPRESARHRPDGLGRHHALAFQPIKSGAEHHHYRGSVEMKSGINQVAIRKDRDDLRFNPIDAAAGSDIIMLGEMRDLDTVTIACRPPDRPLRLSRSTPTAAQPRSRGAEPGCSSYLLASTINCIMAQRLVRHLPSAA